MLSVSGADELWTVDLPKKEQLLMEQSLSNLAVNNISFLQKIENQYSIVISNLDDSPESQKTSNFVYFYALSDREQIDKRFKTIERPRILVCCHFLMEPQGVKDLFDEIYISNLHLAKRAELPNEDLKRMNFIVDASEKETLNCLDSVFREETPLFVEYPLKVVHFIDVASDLITALVE